MRKLLTLFVPILVASVLLLSSGSALAQEGKGQRGAEAPAAVPYTTISSAGPLTEIHLGNEGSAQIRYGTETSYSVFPPSTVPGDYGTFLVIGGTLYAPDFLNHDGTATGGIGARTPFTANGQSVVSGSGTIADPYQVTTALTAGTSGITLSQKDSYVVGEELYRTDITLTNTTATNQTMIIYRAMDCFLGGSDIGYGALGPAAGAVACSENANNSPAGRIEQLLPLTAGSHYYEARYYEVWNWISTHSSFPDTCRCTDYIDNGVGLSWEITIPAGQSTVISNITAFSPTGNLPIVTSKTADYAVSEFGEQNGYTITLTNQNAAAATVTSIVDTLPVGFTYVANSTTGVTSANPTISGQTLTWNGSFALPGNSSISLHFNVIVPNAAGTYYNNATATASGRTVTPTGDAAPITVEAPQTVTLNSFIATRDATGQTITVAWETATELDTLGFNVYRRTDDGSEQRVNSVLVMAQGGLQGASYSLSDADLLPTAAYRYSLEEVATNGTTQRIAETTVDPVTPTAITIGGTGAGSSHSLPMLVVLIGLTALGAVLIGRRR